MRQLNGIDVSFLNMETPTTYGHVSSLNIYDPSGALVLDFTLSAMPGVTSVPFDFQIAEVRSWCPDAPNLYRIRLELKRAGHAQEVVEETFGFRAIETRDGKF